MAESSILGESPGAWFFDPHVATTPQTAQVTAVALFMTSNASYRVFLLFLVCASAALIVLHTVRAEAQYLWAGAFCIVAVLFNTILPIALPSRPNRFAWYAMKRSNPELMCGSVTWM